MDISTLDPNFKIETSFDGPDLVWYSVKQDPFRVYGLYDYKHHFPFVRLPLDVEQATSPGVLNLAYRTAGGRVRFKTDSPVIAIKTTYPGSYLMPHMPPTGSNGFDLYEKKGSQYNFLKMFVPPVEAKGAYDGIFKSQSTKMKDLTIHFPLYYRVDALYIGLKKGSVLLAAPPYKHQKPIVYYGSSTTQGGCASRPGNTYQAHISRWFDADHINLGFSGSGKGEDAICDWMATLEMSMFVSDYDANAPTVEHLKATHYRLYRKIRDAHPDIPYILLSSATKYAASTHNLGFLAVICATYEKAKAEGDKNVYFIHGNELFGEVDRDMCTVDGGHPNDGGFYRIAKRLAQTIQTIPNWN
jgi:hypothetical protein